MTVLREFVSNRGVAMPTSSRELRRPRTCFFTAERPTTTSVDAVWEFENGRCVDLSAEELKESKKKLGFEVRRLRDGLHSNLQGPFPEYRFLNVSFLKSVWHFSLVQIWDILQFTSAIFVADEAEAFTVSVMRLGQLEGEEGSGKAGSRYEHVEGDLIFPSGEFEQSIRIPIIESPLWSATMEFKVVLEHPIGCQLGKYLKICRVKVIDRDSFPSSFYAQEIEEDVESINQTGLFIEYVKLVLEQPGNTWRFLITVIFDQLKNLYVWFTLKASVYMVNVVFGHKEDAEDELLIRDDPAKTAQVLGLMYVFLPLLLHIWKVTKMKLDLNGRCKLYLQSSVMRKYMNFSEESRLEVTQPEVVSFVMQKSEQLAGICDNYTIIAYYFQRPAMNEKFATRATKFNDDGIPEAVYKMNSEFFFDWLAPLFVGLYIAFYSPLVLAKDLPLGTFLATISVFKEVSSNFEDGYAGLKKVISCFEPLVDLTVFLNRPTDVPLLKQFVDIRVAETRKCRKKLLTLPMALAMEEAAAVRTDLIPIRLENIGLTLTLDQCLIYQDGAKKGKTIFQDVNLSVSQGKLVALTGPAGSGKSKLLKMLVGDASPSSGQVLIPSHLRFVLVTHQVFVMSSTPLQKLSQQAMLDLADPSQRNLFFGDPAALGSAEERHRMLWILEKLQMNNTRQLAELELSLLQETEWENEEEEHWGCCHRETRPSVQEWKLDESSNRSKDIRKKLTGWRNSLSFQEKAKLHMARALIMNPEILILEKPLMNLDEAESERVMTVLREYVSNRGVAMSDESRDMRRPRTCIFTAERPTTTLVDAVFVTSFVLGKEQRPPKTRATANWGARGIAQGSELDEQRQRVVSESGHLDAEVQRTRQEVAREAQAMRELRQAEGERDRKAKELEQLSNQLQQVQQEKASVSQEHRREAVTAMVMVLEALWHRWRRSTWHLTLRRWQEAHLALQRKGRRIAVAAKISLLSGCLLLWREVVTSLVAEREAAKHLEEPWQAKRMETAHWG
eukprot:s1840_g11.t1